MRHVEPRISLSDYIMLFTMILQPAMYGRPTTRRSLHTHAAIARPVSPLRYTKTSVHYDTLRRHFSRDLQGV